MLNIKEKYSKEQFYEEILRLYNIFGNIDKNIFQRYSVLDVDFHAYCTKYGGIKNICNELGIEHKLYNQKSEQEIIEKGKHILSKYGKITKELCSKNGISSCVINRIFGCFENFYRIIGVSKYSRRNISKEEVLQDIKDFYDNNSNFSSVEYRKRGKFSFSVINRFGGWKVLLKELGIENKDTRIGFDKIDSKLKYLSQKYGTLNREIVESNTDFTWNCLFWYFKNTEELLTYYGIDANKRKGKSNGELLIIDILKEFNILFEKEKTFPWLINTNGENLFVDFFFPDKNFALEYDGQQHYKFVEYFYKTQQNYINAINRDRLKESLLKEHNIPLVRISYKQKITPELILYIYKQF